VLPVPETGTRAESWVSVSNTIPLLLARKQLTEAEGLPLELVPVFTEVVAFPRVVV
jgi:hypothetical protein